MRPTGPSHPLVLLAIVLTALIALALGFAAVQELIVRGIRGGEAQPLVVGVVGGIVSALILAAAMALRSRAALGPRLALWAATLSVAFHVYAALPPHRNVGPTALLLAIVASAALAWLARRDAPTGGAPAT